MRILLTAATQMELDNLTNLGEQVDLLVSGVGVPATVFSLTRALVHQPYDLVIQVGLAGSFKKELVPGKVVLVESDIFADLGLEEKGLFTPLAQSALRDAYQPDNPTGYLINPNKIAEKFNLPMVKGMTVNTVTDEMQQNEKFQNLYQADVESMEGAALHWVCLQMQIPFVQIRAISNFVGERDKAKWQIKESLQELCLFMGKASDLLA